MFPTAAAEIQALAVELLEQYNVSIVVIMEMLTFPVHGTPWCQRVNQVLRERVADSRRIWFWKHRREMFSQRRSPYSRDRVHLGHDGMTLYWSGVRRAAVAALARV